MHDHRTIGDLKPRTREDIDHIHLQCKLWAAESRAATEYEVALDELGIAIPHEQTPEVTLFDRLRPIAVTTFFVCIAFFLYGWGVL